MWTSCVYACFHHSPRLCANYPVCSTSPTQTDVCRGHISLLPDVPCHPVVGDLRFNHGWTVLQASSLPLVSAHNSLCRRASQSGATAGLSRSCSGFDLSPFTYDLSHCGRLLQLGELRETSQQRTMKTSQRAGLGLVGLWARKVTSMTPCSHLSPCIYTPYIKNCVRMLLDSDVVKWRMWGYEPPWLWSSGCWQLLSHSPCLSLEKRNMGFFFTIEGMLRENIL